MSKTNKTEARRIAAIRMERPGVRSVGPYEAGAIYIVGENGLTNEEATRLVDHKGFTELSSAQVRALATKGE
jgi:hypothetical protein